MNVDFEEYNFYCASFYYTKASSSKHDTEVLDEIIQLACDYKTAGNLYKMLGVYYQASECFEKSSIQFKRANLSDLYDYAHRQHIYCDSLVE